MASLPQARVSVPPGAELAALGSGRPSGRRPHPGQELGVCGILAGVGSKGKWLSGPGRPSARTRPRSVPWCRVLDPHLPATFAGQSLPGPVCLHLTTSRCPRRQAGTLRGEPAPPNSPLRPPSASPGQPGPRLARGLNTHDMGQAHGPEASNGRPAADGHLLWRSQD